MIKKIATLYKVDRNTARKIAFQLRNALAVRIATPAYLEREGLNLAKLKKDEACMLYSIDVKNNTSKFYEILITLDDSNNTYSLIKKWGRLTDRGSGGRADGSEQHGLSLEDAKSKLNEIRNKKLKKGYIDVMGDKHVSPNTGKPLTRGEYPISPLTSGNFGWGGQSVNNCLKDLKTLEKEIQKTIKTLSKDGEIRKEDLAKVLSHIKDSLLLLEYSPTASKIIKKIDRLERRLKGDARFSPDPSGDRFLDDLINIKSYLEQQLSYCK